MKAVVYEECGPPEVLQLKDVDKPVPKENEVLIKVKAASLNASDLEFLTGKPFYTRAWGLFKPRYTILGSDIAGVVEAVGEKVKQFNPGDEVFGDIFEQWGGVAEFVCAPEDRIVLKPASLNYQEAAAFPQAAVVALQGLRDKGELKPKQKVLINGAGGGAGTFALRLGKILGAEITGVDSTEKLEIMRSTGADHVIDYTKEDFTKNNKQYDLILDLVASHSIFDYKRALTTKGSYIMVGGGMSHLFQTLVLGSLISIVSSKKMGLLAHKQNKKDLAFMAETFENEKLKPVIDKIYPLNETAKAFRYLADGHAKGKIVITM